MEEALVSRGESHRWIEVGTRRGRAGIDLKWEVREVRQRKCVRNEACEFACEARWGGR